MAAHGSAEVDDALDKAVELRDAGDGQLPPLVCKLCPVHAAFATRKELCEHVAEQEHLRKLRPYLKQVPSASTEQRSLLLYLRSLQRAVAGNHHRELLWLLEACFKCTFACPRVAKTQNAENITQRKRE